jgi:uncharacterized protein (TIGR03437 family)
MAVRHVFMLVTTFSLTCWCQAPVIFPGGVVNAADYATAQASYASETVRSLASGSIVSIFGSNLALVTQTAKTVPLPTQLAETSVTVNGIPAPLFYVSPGQINFQMPSPWLESPPPGAPGGIVVTTPVGASDPYLTLANGGMGGTGVFGIFTVDASGCGQGSVLNLGSTGNLSPNSPSNSASPGDYISIFGTGIGIVFNSPLTVARLQRAR